MSFENNKTEQKPTNNEQGGVNHAEPSLRDRVRNALHISTDKLRDGIQGTDDFLKKNPGPNNADAISHLHRLQGVRTNINDLKDGLVNELNEQELAQLETSIANEDTREISNLVKMASLRKKERSALEKQALLEYEQADHGSEAYDVRQRRFQVMREAEPSFEHTAQNLFDNIDTKLNEVDAAEKSWFNGEGKARKLFENVMRDFIAAREQLLSTENDLVKNLNNKYTSIADSEKKNLDKRIKGDIRLQTDEARNTMRDAAINKFNHTNPNTGFDMTDPAEVIRRAREKARLPYLQNRLEETAKRLGVDLENFSG